MANPVSEYRNQDSDGVHVLFAMGLTQSFFEAPQSGIPEIMEAFTSAFDDLEGRFGVRVLGTLDDDETLLGNTDTWPWTCYILAHAPDRAAAARVCNQLRETVVGDDLLWKYVKIEARVGRPLFFGTR